MLKILNKLQLVKVSIIKSYCIGAGFILAMNTDICLANTNCLFSIPASKLNIRLPSNQLDFFRDEPFLTAKYSHYLSGYIIYLVVEIHVMTYISNIWIQH